MTKKRGPWLTMFVGGEVSLNQIVAVKLLTRPRLPILASLLTNAMAAFELPAILLADIFSARPDPWMPEFAVPWRSMPTPAVEVSMFSVTAKPPPLVSLAVVVPGPASSNGNLSIKVWAGVVWTHINEEAQITAASVIQ